MSGTAVFAPAKRSSTFRSPSPTCLNVPTELVGSETACSSMRRNRSTRASIVARSNRSTSYSSRPDQSRSDPGRGPRRSNREVRLGSAIPACSAALLGSPRPQRAGRSPERADCVRGLALARVPRRASRTADPGGRSRRGLRCERARPVLRSSATPERSTRSTSVLTKNPISPSVSGRLRLAIGARNDDVVLAGPAAEQDVEGGEQHHEERRPRASREVQQFLDQRVGIANARSAPRCRCTGGRGRSVGMSSTASRSAALASSRSRVPASLGSAVRAARWRSRRIAPAVVAGPGAVPRERLVSSLELAAEDGERPPVGHNVVHGDDKQVIATVQPRHHHPRSNGPRERSTAGPEKPTANRRSSASRRSPGSRRRSTASDGPASTAVRDLHRLLAVLIEDGPQDLMVIHDELHRRAEQADVEREADRRDEGEVVERVLRHELVEEPQTGLGE